MSHAQATAAYRQNAVNTATPEKLVRMLYEKAIVHLEKSHAGMSDPATTRSAEVGESLGQAMSLIGELRSSLDSEGGGEIAGHLEALYEYSMDQISQANITRSADYIEAPLRVMRTLKEGWDAILPA